MTINPLRPDDGSQMTRLQAFSDGVFAIDITLLVLNVRVPTYAEAGVNGLRAFAASYLFILVMWINHHRLFRVVSDRALINHISRQYSFGPFLYLGALLLGLVSPILSLLLSVLFALFFALPNQPVDQLDVEKEGRQ